jgi:Arc/MetJ-type ribon-helix-helix transcriptional regulator
MMTVRPPATVVLRPEAADYAADLVRSGEYRSVDDVVSDALVALDERRARQRVGEAALRERLHRAVAQLDRGESIAGAPEVVIGEIFEEALAQSRP